MRRVVSHARCAHPLLALATSCLVAGCGERPKLERGEECEVTTECTSPLVCRLSRCREECRSSRDCDTDATCVMDESGLGGCQLEPELDCIMPSDCPGNLVCANRHCVNECADRRDCPSGAMCLNDPAGGGNVCVDMWDVECDFTSQCGDTGLVCAVDGHCRPECREPRDCRPEETCDTSVAMPVCVLISNPDGGSAPDAGMMLDGGP